MQPLSSSFTRQKASIWQPYMLAQKRLKAAFLCIIQTFVEWLGGIRECFKLDRDSFLDRIRFKLFSPFSQAFDHVVMLVRFLARLTRFCYARRARFCLFT